MQYRRPQQIQLSIKGRDAPLKRDPTPTCHREQVAIPGGLSGVGDQGPVRAMVFNKLLKVSEEVRWVHETLREPGRLLGHDPGTGDDTGVASATRPLGVELGLYVSFLH